MSSKKENVIVPRKKGSLARALFAGELEHDALAALPAESIYLAIQEIGVESALEIVRVLPTHTLRLLLDFDSWSKDTLREDSFWRWLSLVLEQQDTKLLDAFLEAIDHNVLYAIIARHTSVVYLEEPTDAPPGEGLFSPDSGYTWIGLLVDSETHKLALASLLNHLLLRDQEALYRLLSVAHGATPVEHEEEGYAERSRRLLDEGIPDHELSARLHAPLNAETFGRLLKGESTPLTVELPQTIVPLVDRIHGLQPLASFLRELQQDELVEAELSLLANAAIVLYGVDFSDLEAVREQLELVRGALNVGLERCYELHAIAAVDLYSKATLQSLYRLGLAELQQLQRIARNMLETLATAIEQQEPSHVLLLQALAMPFPRIPVFVTADGTLPAQGVSTSTELRAIETLHQKRGVERLIRERFQQ